MLTWIRKLIAAPVFEDEEKTRAAGLLNIILLILLGATTLVIPCLAVVVPSDAMFSLPIGAVVAAMALGLRSLTRRGHVRTASMLLSSFLLVVVTVTIYIFSGIRSNVATAYFLVIAIAALLLSGRAALTFGLLSILAALGVFYAEIRGAIVISMPASAEFADWFLLSVVLGMGTLLLRFAVHSIAGGFERARQEITERKQAEEALRLSEERFALAVQGSNAGIWDWDIPNHSLYWSPRMKELLGYADDELDVDYDTFVSHLHPGDREHTQAAMEAHLKDRGLYEVEQRLRTKSGEYRWFLSRGQALWDEGGNPLRMVGSTTDITKRKRAEEETRRHLERIEALREIDRAITSTLDLTEVLDIILEELEKVIPYHSAAIFLLSDDTARLTAGRGFPDLERALRVSFFVEEDALTRELLHQKRPLVLADAQADERFLARGGTGYIRSWIGVPLIARGRVTGFLTIDHREPRVYDGGSAEMAQAFASQVAIAIENARLYEAIQRELAERKRAEEALRVSESKYRTLVENIPQKIFVKDRNSVYVSANGNYARDLGITPEAIAGKVDYDFFPRELADKYRGDDQRTMELGKTEEIEEKYIQDGQEVWVQTLKTPIRNEQGDVVGILGIFWDITERKRAEQLLRALNQAALAMERALTPEDIFTAVAEELKKLGFSCIVFLTDESQSNLFPKYLSYETGALKVLEKLVGLKHEDFPIPVETVDAYREVIWEKRTIFVENAEDTLRQALPAPVKRLAGQIVRVLKVPQAIAAPLVVRDEVIGMFSVQSDHLTKDDIPAITAFAHQMAAAWRKAQLMQDLQNSLEELKLAEAQLVQAQKMEAIGTLAGGVAHDFNNVLMTIMLYTDLLLDDPSLPPDLAPDVEGILDEVQEGTRLVRQILDFSRRSPIETRLVDLRAFMQEAVETLQRIMLESIHLVLEMGPDEYVVKADPTRLQQVMMNLGINAWDAMSNGGELSFGLSRVEVSPGEEPPVPEMAWGEWVCLTVSDTGTGMPPEVVSHLFEPFFTTKPRGEGTGLGLAQVYGIVKQHEGHIGVETGVGRGTTFRIYLPAQRAGELEEFAEGVLTAPGGRGETVLVAEDEGTVRELCRRILERLGYQVLTAANGRQALEVYRSAERVDLLLTDVVMPEMGGGELIRELKKTASHLKTVAMTGYVLAEDLRELKEEGSLRVVYKPLDTKTLAQVVRQALDSDKKT